MKKYALLSVIFFSIACLHLRCKDAPPGLPTAPTIQLALEDASCTEAWLKISLTDANEPRTIALKRDGQTVLTARLPANDTTLVDTSLLPKRNYSYQAVRLNNGSTVDTSPTLQVATMDTTSHNFTWQIDTLGATSSVLYDVAIINDTLAYAVGEMYLRDSMGQIDPILYNLAKWNGHSWEIKRILSDCRLYYPNCGPVFFTPSPGKAVFAFGPNDVWIVAGGVHHFDGTSWMERRSLVEIGGTNKMWGSDSNDMWFVGRSGLIVHYNGSTWQRVESGTSVDIRDIWGARSAKNGTLAILAIASFKVQLPQARKLLQIDPTNNTVAALNVEGLSLNVNGVWFDPDRRYYVVGDGVYSSLRLGNFWLQDTTQRAIYSDAIRGNAFNNVMIAGSYGRLAHYNGWTWKQYTDTPTFYGRYYAVSIKGDFEIAVGWIDDKAVVMRAKQ